MYTQKERTLMLIASDEEPVHIDDLTWCLYQSNSPKDQKNARKMIKRLTDSEWDITAQGGGMYAMGSAHRELLSAGLPVIGKQELSPETVRMALWEQLQSIGGG